MIFNEQILKNKNRIFYHGSKNAELNIENANYDWFFVTTDINTAIMYCEKKEEINYVHTFHLDKPINVFNARSDLDFAKLRKALIRRGKIDFVNNSDYMYQLKYKDWLFLDETYLSRYEIVDIIQSLGYDGFFNSEWNLDYQNGKHFNLSDVPSIGLFNIDCLKPLKVLSFEEIKANTKYDELKKKSKEKIANDIKEVVEYCTCFKNKYGKLPSDKSIEDHARSLIGFNYYTTLTDKEINEIIEDIKNKVANGGVSKQSQELFESYGKCNVKGMDITVPAFARRKLDEDYLKYELIYENNKEQK